MLEELLADLLSPGQVQSLLEPAVLERDFARQALDDRVAVLSRLAEQSAGGVWRSPHVAAAVAQATSDRLLLRMSCQKYVDAQGGRCDLDNEYHPLLPPGRMVALDDLTAALGFIAAARPNDPPELWFGALQDEATAYLHQLRGDVYLAQAIGRLDALEGHLLALLDPTDPYAARNIVVHSAAAALFRELRLPWRVEIAYLRFLAASPNDPSAGWHSRADSDAEYQDATLNAYYSLVLDAQDALCLRNPSDRSEIERLNAEQPPPDFAPALAMYEPDVVPLPDLPPSVSAAAAAALDRIAGALKPARSSAERGRARRPAAVLSAWHAFALRGSRNFQGLARRLRRVKPDDEALGIVVQALRGEAYYRMGRYEDGYLDLLAAEEAARAGLGRRASGNVGSAGWTEAERDAVARLAQKAGNALAIIGDDERAGEAYARAAELATGPLARAGNLVNGGNRHFVRNSVVGGQGYITLDAEARQLFVLRGPERLRETVVGQHVSSLCAAERAYWAALDALRDGDVPAAGAQALAAACHMNLGNVGWAWGRTLDTEEATRIADLPLGATFTSRLVTPESDARACYEAAVNAYAAVLRQLGAEQAGARGAAPVSPDALHVVITALSSSSEMRCLTGRELLREAARAGAVGSPHAPFPRPEPGSEAAATLTLGLDEARRCLALIRKDDAALYPDLVWRTQYNLARLYRLLGETTRALTHFRRAVDAVERLRAELRVDSLQAAFLHDKHDVYEGYIDLLLAQDPVGNLPQVFELFERSRARAFLSLLQAVQVKTGLPKELAAKVEDLLAKISACNEAIQASIAADCPEEANALLAEQRRLARRWSDMQSRIAVYQQRGRTAPSIATLAGFQAALTEDQAFLGVLLGDEASYLLLIDRADARAFRLPPRRTLELLALPVLTCATSSNAETAAAFRAVNVALTAALLGPVDDALGLRSWLKDKHLLVSPDGILCYLPMDVLLADTAGVTELPDTADYPDLVPYYLLSMADISYVPSASAWLEQKQRAREPSRAGLMAVYNVLYDMPNPPLWAVTQQIMLKLGAVTTGPDMKRLSEAVKKAWGEDVPVIRLRSRTDEGAPEEEPNQSTERNFLRVAPDARPRVLLFHGHGIYNDRYPSLSGLVFNLQTTPDREKRAAIPTAEDGFLRVEELFELELPGVELAFLAACQTALGAYRRGEGLNALVRGFLHRGSPAVVATLWEVRADVTALLLRVFFRLLSEQPDADRARLFSQAKRKVMPLPANLYLPYFWAPFVLWGYTGPLAGQERRSR